MVLGLSRSAVRLHALCAFFALGSLVWGYNIGILSTLYAHPGFKKQLGNPSPSQTGLITAIYYLGTWLSYMFLSSPLSDFLGRRYAAMVGMCITCLGSAILTGASGSPSRAYSMCIAGRIIGGLGTAIVSTTVPTYQSEVAPPLQRGRFVVMNHIGLVLGLASAFWVGYGISFWEDTERGLSTGWRLSESLQFVPAIAFIIGLPFVPETPRWLFLKQRDREAHKSLHYFREGSLSDDEIAAEAESIRASVSMHQLPWKTKWIELWTKKDLFKRLWRASLLHFMAQACGATAVKYYLPTLFRKLGIEYRLSLLITGIESTLKIGCTIFEMLVVDSFGRRNTMVAGALLMSFAMLVNGALPIAYPNNANRASDYACIVFIFFYTFGYSIGFGPGAWIFPTTHRAVGLNVAASFGALGSIIVSQVWPIGIAHIGSRTYFIFMVINLACVPIIFFLYPETKKMALESIKMLYDDKNSLDSNHTNENAVMGDGFHKGDSKHGHEIGDAEVQEGTKI